MTILMILGWVLSGLAIGVWDILRYKRRLNTWDPFGLGKNRFQMPVRVDIDDVPLLTLFALVGPVVYIAVLAIDLFAEFPIGLRRKP